jgi:hypothetical protein
MELNVALRTGPNASVIHTARKWIIALFTLLCCGLAMGQGVSIVTPAVDGGIYVNGLNFKARPTDPAIQRVVFDADGYPLGEGRLDNEWSFRYTFTTLGERNITASGYSASGALLGQARMTITVVDMGISTPRVGETIENGAPIKVWASPRVAQVKYFADSWPIGTSSQRDANGQFVLRPSPFNQLGERLLRAEAYDAQGYKVSETQVAVKVVNSGFVSPAEGANFAAGVPVTLQVTAHNGITKVVYYADDVELIGGTSTNAGSGFRVEIVFSKLGQRKLTAVSYDAKGQIVDTDAVSIQIADGNPGGGSRKWGAWIWTIDQHRKVASNHAEMAQHLAKMGVKRVYIKIADGNRGAVPGMDFPDDDPKVAAAYKARGIEPWAWAYNYPTTRFSAASQADFLYKAAKMGYRGFVADVEGEFERAAKPAAEVGALFSAFADARKRAQAEGLTSKGFGFYATTFGWISQHAAMNVGIMDRYVDAHLPQTYTVFWGSNSMASPKSEIARITQQYRDAGATKPIHHIASIEYSVSGGTTRQLSAAQLQSFMDAAGNEASIWAVPRDTTAVSNMEVPFQSWALFRSLDWGGAVNPPPPPPPGTKTLNQKYADWFENNANYDKVYNDVVNGWYGSTTNACVAFSSAAMRLSGLMTVPKVNYADLGGNNWLWTPAWTRWLINERKWVRRTDPDQLLRGDIVFTISDPRQFGSGVPTHVYMFSRWHDRARGIAIVLDNQMRYEHRRNITTALNPQDAWERKDRMAYFLRAPQS